MADPNDTQYHARRAAIFEAVRTERDQQDWQFGGYAYDVKHTVNDWVALVVRHAGRAMDGDASEFRRRMLRVAALSIAAVETLDAAHSLGDTLGPRTHR